MLQRFIAGTCSSHFSASQFTTIPTDYCGYLPFPRNDERYIPFVRRVNVHRVTVARGALPSIKTDASVMWPLAREYIKQTLQHFKPSFPLRVRAWFVLYVCVCLNYDAD